MKKGLLGACLACMMGLSMFVPVEAVYRPSVVMDGEPAGRGARIVDADGNRTEIDVVEPGSYTGLIDDIQRPVVQVTPASRTLKYKKKATGLDEKGNELTNVVYKVITDSKDTEDLLDKFDPKAKAVFRKEMKAGKRIDDYEPLTLFDVSANDVAKEQMKDGNIEVDVKVDGIKKEDDDKLIVLHFHGDEENKNISQIRNESKVKDTFTDFSALKHKVDKDNVLTLEMDAFSPVLVFKEVDRD